MSSLHFASSSSTKNCRIYDREHEPKPNYVMTFLPITTDLPTLITKPRNGYLTLYFCKTLKQMEICWHIEHTYCFSPLNKGLTKLSLRNLTRDSREASVSRDCDIRSPAPVKSVKLEACLFTAACCLIAVSQMP